MTNEIIKTIEIEIAGVTVKVTPEQAKSLHSALGELLNLKTEKVVEREIVRDHYYPYVRPFITYTGANGIVSPSQPNKWTVNCTTATANLKIQ